MTWRQLFFLQILKYIQKKGLQHVLERNIGWQHVLERKLGWQHVLKLTP